MSEEEQNIPVRSQNFSIMEAFDKQSKMTDQDTGDDYTQDSFTEKFLSGGETDPKKQKYSKKQIMDTNTLQLKREFEEMMKKQEMDKTKVQNEAELKKLLNEAIVYTKEKNKKLESAYTQFQKIIEEEASLGGSGSKKPTLKNFSTKTLQFPQILDNRNAHKLEVSGLASTDENIKHLQDHLEELQQNSEDLSMQVVFESEKTASLTSMSKELEKTIQMSQEEINCHDEIALSYQKQIDQADEKVRKYNNEVHATQVEIQKYQRYIRADSKQKQSFIADKNKSIDEQKHDLKDTIAEYKKLQNEMEAAKAKNEQKLEEIKNKEINKKLRTKFELMLESRKLLKELDDFDKLTKIFVYGDPSQHDLADLEKQIQSDTPQDPQEDNDLTSYLSSDQNAPSPTYKQGTIITRLRRFYKFHGEDLNSVVDKILKIYGEYNMQNHTLQRRLSDLQEQKRKLAIIWSELHHEEDDEDVSQRVPQYEDDEAKDELESPMKKRSNSEIIKSKLSKNRISQDDINDLQQFIGHCFLFLNESLFRMVGTTSLIRGLPNTQDQIKKDEKFQEEYFKNELFDNLQLLINYSVANKGLLMSNKNPEDSGQQTTTVGEQNLSNQLSSKIIDISKSFQKNLPQIADRMDQFTEIVKKDFVLLNFCPIDSFIKFFESLKEKLDNAQATHTNEEIWKRFEEKLQTKLRDKGRTVFIKMLNKLLTYIQQLLQRVQAQKEKIYLKLQETHPDSPVFKPSHVRKRLEDKKQKKKDWKDKLVKNKIKEYENYQGITVEQEQQAGGGLVQYLTDLISQSEGGQMKGEQDFEDEKKHIDLIWQKEKMQIGKQVKEQKDIQSKVQEKPKVNSKYLEQSKYGLKYTESWKFLVKSKKEFGTQIWDSESENFYDVRTLRTQFPPLNETRDTSKPEHLFSHVMYQSTHPHLESKFNQSQRVRMNTISMTDQEMTTLRKSNLNNHPFTQSQHQLANMRKISNNPRSNSYKDSDTFKNRSKSHIGVSNSNSVVLSKSRLLDARDEHKIMQIKTNSLNKGYGNGKPTRIHTESALESIKQNSQMI